MCLIDRQKTEIVLRYWHRSRKPSGSRHTIHHPSHDDNNVFRTSTLPVWGINTCIELSVLNVRHIFTGIISYIGWNWNLQNKQWELLRKTESWKFFKFLKVYFLHACIVKFSVKHLQFWSNKIIPILSNIYLFTIYVYYVYSTILFHIISNNYHVKAAVSISNQ